MKFMTVDDAKVIRMMMGNLVGRFMKGSEFVQAENGAVALKVLEENPDVKMIFVDWNMPIMNGFEFIKSVRANPDYNDIKLIMVTTEGEKSKVAEAAKVGINGYVVKPFEAETLEKVLRRYFEF
jgi:two-component system, chemotaxis family, chemotaxis protein CheY